MTRRLALIAGTGALVPEVLAAARQSGFDLLVLSIRDLPGLAGARLVKFRLSQPQVAIDAIRQFGATHFTLAGGVALSDLMREGLARFLSGGAADVSLGDTGISELVLRVRELTGAEPLGVHEIAPNLLAPEGLIGGPAPSAELQEFARHALDLARRAGSLDLGQALVTAGRRAIAAEDIGGTDALLRRVRRLRWKRLVADGDASPLVLAKCPKPGQPRHIDLPAIGPQTVRNAKKSGIRLIALEAGGSLLIDRAGLRAEATRLGISVIGLAHG